MEWWRRIIEDTGMTPPYDPIGGDDDRMETLESQRSDDMDGSYDEDDLGSDVICVACGELVGWDDCEACGGEGTVHDCGEDTCNCLHPEDQDQQRCARCGGEGAILVCEACGVESHEEA